ncbi:hypothetical protein D1007_29763 [Hordeum vulgare]|nr:hypothetical protein D1007_29763 [Hordeum vulgare]
MATPAFPLHIHTLLSGVLPPLSSFLIGVLLHYQIHALHLDPSSLVLLSAFVFLCEAFVGVTPSLALLHHFFSLEFFSEEQCFGCTSLKTADASVPRTLNGEVLPEVEGFRGEWVHVETAEAGALFQPPSTPTTSNRGWMREELNEPQITLVLTRLEKLMFMYRRIAPFQGHSHLMWAYTGPRDTMRIQVLPLSSHVLREFLRRRTRGDPDELPQNGLPLYNSRPWKLSSRGCHSSMSGGSSQGDARPGRASTFGVQAHKTLVMLPLPQLGWAVYRRPLPRLLLRVEPGLVVMTGRWWKSSPRPQASIEGCRVSTPGHPRWPEEEVA